MNHSHKLRKVLKNAAIRFAQENKLKYTEYKSAIIFKNISDNFEKQSHREILQNTEYYLRTKKKHSFFGDGTLEMQSSTSSDALLMNIFCYPKIQNWKGIKRLLDIDNLDVRKFGYIPKIENKQNMRKTEIDMKIGNVFFEAKLTEYNFTGKELGALLSKYPSASKVFNLEELSNEDGKVNNYQLIRNILTAYKYEGRFILLVDCRRSDLIREYYRTLDSIKSRQLKIRMKFITWQEITNCLGAKLKSYIKRKYAI